MKNKTKNLKALMEVFKRLNNLRRWTGDLTDSKYDQISKLGLNCIVSFFLATEENNKCSTVKWERFPKIAIYRAFQKAYIFYDTPEYIFKEICEIGNMNYEQVVRDITFQVISEKTDDDFAKWLEDGCKTYEERIYKAATKIATLLEARENKGSFNGDYLTKLEEIIKEMVKYEDLPSFKEMSNPDGSYFEAFKLSSKLRNQNRWAAYSYNVNSAVLGHLFDTAVLAYWMALENEKTETEATKCFFIGIFHDIAEAFTRDIPSPIKDKIPGFREASEKYEIKKMEECFYPLLTSNAKKALKKVMMEESENQYLKKLMKGADYLSASAEIWRQFPDEAFLEAITLDNEKFKSGKAALSKSGYEVYNIMLEYVKSFYPSNENTDIN